MPPNLAASPRTESGRPALRGRTPSPTSGVFAAPDRRLVFDINDFDETHPGPFEWTSSRLVASFAIGGRELGFKERDRSAAVANVGAEYRSEMRRLAAMRTLDVWYERLDVASLDQYRSQVKRKAARNYDNAIAKAESKNQPPGLREADPPGRRGAAHRQRPPLITPVEDVFDGAGADEIMKQLLELLAQYRKTWMTTFATSSRSTGSSTPPGKWGGSGSVGGREHGSCSCLGRDSEDHCSCR